MKKISFILMLLLLSGCSNSEVDEQTLVVGMECGYVPFNWQTPKETATSAPIGGAGYCDGYDVSMARKLADRMGLKLQVKKIAWKGLQPALQSGDIDVIIAGMTANKEREAGLDFTSPYYESQMAMIVRKKEDVAHYTDIQQFQGKKVIGQLGTSYDDVIDQIEGVIHMTPKESYPEMVLALQNKEVDAITAELPVAQGVVSANENLTIVTFAKGKNFVADTSVSIALKEGTRGSTFFQQIQETLDKISKEERDAMMKEAAAASARKTI